MARRLSQNDPALSIEFFNSGFYTHRSQLFAPFKGIGVNVVSFHDPVIDGNNMEDTDLYEWQRRPGFTIFCPTPLADTEIVNEFYFYRNLNGTVVPLFDSTARLATFSNVGLSTIVAKSVPQQGYITAVGNMMYFSDGASADYYKQDGTNLSAWGLAAPTVAPISSGLGFWQPKTSFGFGQSLLDTNGNIESLSSISIPNGAYANPTFFSVIPLAGSGEVAWDFAPPYNNLSDVPGTYPGYAVSTVGPGYNNYLFLGSFNLAIPTGAIIVGIKAVLYKESVSGNGRNWVITDESVRLVIGGAVVGTEHASIVQWSNNTVSASTYGSPTDTWGLAPTAAQLNANEASGFGIVISANAGSGSGIPNTVLVGTTGANVKAVLTVYYQPTSTVSPSAPGISGQFEPVWPITIATPVQDGAVVWTNYGPILTWYPVTFYPTPVVILDSNGNLQLGSSASNTTAEWNAGTTYATGSVVTYGGLYWISVFAGANIGVPPATNYTVFTSGTGVTAPYWQQTLNPIATGNVVPVWNTTVGGLTEDGNYTWENIGQGSGLAFTGYEYVYAFRTIYGHLTTASPFSNATGPILGPMNGSISSFSITSNVITFIGNNNFIVGNMFQVAGLSTVVGATLNEQALTVTAVIPSSSFPLTSVAVNGSNVVTILANNRLVVGQQVIFSGIGTATFLNGQTLTVLATGLSGTQFEASSGTFTHASYGPVTDFGTVNALGSFSASYAAANVSSTPDSGEAFPLISTVTGLGTASPLCNSVATITKVAVTGDIVTLTANNNFQPGIWITLSGLTAAAFLNGQQAEVIAVDQPVGTQNTYFQIYFVTPNYPPTVDAGLATFNAVEIYRTSDGGGIYLFAGAVTNPGPNLGWTFNDFVPDANLDVELIAALDHQNDPPPGAPGSIITTSVGTRTAYWQGRLWMIVGNYVYFDAGPDCENGIPEESWPPSYRFQFAGPPLGLEMTPDGVGMLVYLADRVNAILGGPETISFYPTDFLTNFGISNPNALYRDGSTIGQFTTQKQYIELMGVNKNDVGEHIADYLSANFISAKSRVTMHRNGLDVGVFISNGVDRIVRYGSNIGAWSVPAFPTFGAGALRSIETSVGIYSLMAASPIGGVTSSIGPLNPISGASIIQANMANLPPVNGAPVVNFTTTGTPPTGSTGAIGGALNYAVWQAFTNFPTGTRIVDSNGNLQIATIGGVTKSGSPPVWSMVLGGTTVDGNSSAVLWTLIALAPLSIINVGDIIILQVKIDPVNGAATTVNGATDTMGNVWNVLVSNTVVQSFDGRVQTLALLYARATATIMNGGTFVVTVTTNNSLSNYFMRMAGISNIGFPIAGTSAVINSSAGPFGPGNLITAVNEAIFYSAYADSTFTLYPPAGFSSISSGSGGANTGLSWLPEGVPSTYNPTITQAEAENAIVQQYGFSVPIPPPIPWVNPNNITLGQPTTYTTALFLMPGSSQILRATFGNLPIPSTAVVQGIQVSVTGKQTDISGDLNLTITPTNGGVGAETHTFAFGTSNTTVSFGTTTDLWGMPWNTPFILNAGALAFDIVANFTGLSSTPTVSISEVRVTLTYQTPGNYLYARDLNSWGDGGQYGQNNGEPYSTCNVVVGNITLAQLGARGFPLQHFVGYFDAVGNLGGIDGTITGSSIPDVWILPNEVSNTAGIGFIELPEVVQEPPQGQNHPSKTILALRWNVNMMNSYLASQFMHHLQVKIQFEPENAPNTIKAISFCEDQAT